MTICYATPKERGEKLCDEEDGDKIACPKTDRGFCRTVLFSAGTKEETFLAG